MLTPKLYRRRAGVIALGHQFTFRLSPPAQIEWGVRLKQLMVLTCYPADL